MPQMSPLWWFFFPFVMMIVVMMYFFMMEESFESYFYKNEMKMSGNKNLKW